MSGTVFGGVALGGVGTGDLGSIEYSFGHLPRANREWRNRLLLGE